MPLVLLLVLLSVGWAEAQSYQWSLVRFGEKGQFNTVATGTNDAGWIVGNYDGNADPSLPRGAFRFSQGKFYDFQVPGAEDAENVVWRRSASRARSSAPTSRRRRVSSTVATAPCMPSCTAMG